MIRSQFFNDGYQNTTTILTGGNMLIKSIVILLLALIGNIADVDAQTMRNSTRGELLYSTHCVVCHDTQIHWRDNKTSTDWISLRAEVRRWQKLSALNWDNDDITVVARYLNDLHYHYPIPD